MANKLGVDVLVTVVLPKRDRCQLTKITNTAIARRKQHSQALDARASCAEASSGINGHSRPWQTSFTCSTIRDVKLVLERKDS